MKDLRNIIPRARPGEFHHDDEAALWLRRHRNAIDVAGLRDRCVCFGIKTAQAVDAARLCNGGGYG